MSLWKQESLAALSPPPREGGQAADEQEWPTASQESELRVHGREALSLGHLSGTQRGPLPLGMQGPWLAEGLVPPTHQP